MHNTLVHSREVSDLAQIVSGDYPLISGENSIVLSDIDLTLIRPSNILGGSLLYDWMLNKTMKEKNLSKQEAMTYITELNHGVSERATSEPVEGETTRKTVNLIRQRAPMLGCTARRPDIADQTLDQLRLADISLEDKDGLTFQLAEEGVTVAEYKNGVLFTGSKHSKGHIFELFLKANTDRLTAKQIILIDDMEENLQRMAPVITSLGMRFIGIHYTKATLKPLTDEEAKSALEPFIREKDATFQAKYGYLLT